MPVSYFTAVIAADGRAWRARDVDVEDAGSLDDLAETLRAVAHSEKPVLAVIEHEDEWFALVRVDGDEDARVFVSDLAAAARGPYAEILSSAGEVDTGVVVDDDGEVPPAAAAPADEPTQPTGGVGDLDGLLDEADDDGDLPDDVPDGEIPTGAGDDEVPDVGDLDQPDPPPPPPWAGDAALLDDLGIDKARLCALSEDNTDDPAAALAEIGEQVGFADLLEALR